MHQLYLPEVITLPVFLLANIVIIVAIVPPLFIFVGNVAEQERLFLKNDLINIETNAKRTV